MNDRAKKAAEPMTPLQKADLREYWKNIGGSFHGPATIPEERLLPLLDELHQARKVLSSDATELARLRGERQNMINFVWHLVVTAQKHLREQSHRCDAHVGLQSLKDQLQWAAKHVEKGNDTLAELANAKRERDAWEEYHESGIMLDDLALDHPNHQAAIERAVKAFESLVKAKGGDSWLVAREAKDRAEWAKREQDERESEVTRLRTALATAQADSARIEWLEKHSIAVRDPLAFGSRAMFSCTPDDFEGEGKSSNLRAAIDSAMKPTP